MGAAMDRTVEDARSVGAAAHGLLLAIRAGGADVDSAVDWLEVNAVQVIGDPTKGFDADGEAPTDEELLATATAQLSIGTTLLAAEAATESPQQVGMLQAATGALDGVADALAVDGAGPLVTQGFDVSPGGVLRSVNDAARAALDEMAGGAAEVATSVLDKTLKPVLEHIVAEPIRNIVKDLDLDVGGRLGRWGLRAVRRGLDILWRLVSIDAIERVRDRIEAVLKRLGGGDDAAVLAGWAIAVRIRFVRTSPARWAATEKQIWWPSSRT